MYIPTQETAHDDVVFLFGSTAEATVSRWSTKDGDGVEIAIRERPGIEIAWLYYYPGNKKWEISIPITEPGNRSIPPQVSELTIECNTYTKALCALYELYMNDLARNKMDAIIQAERYREMKNA